MKMLSSKNGLIAVVLLLVVILTACQSVQADAPAEVAAGAVDAKVLSVAEESPALAEDEAPVVEEGAQEDDDDDASMDKDKDKDKDKDAKLVTASVVARLTNQPTRAIVSARGNSFIIDSIPPLGGTNEELNPMDILLGSVATCASFVYEGAANEMGIELDDISATAEGDFDARGLLGEEGVSPRVQVFRVHMDVSGATEKELDKLEAEYKARCPIYTTFSRAATIEVTTNEEQPSAPTEGLNTASAVSRVSNQPGRAIVSSRGNHYVVDSVPPLGGPNEMRNPLDLALGALATCATILYEVEANEQGVPLTGLAATVEADFDPRGMEEGSKINPRIRAFRLKMELEGPTAEQAEALEAAYVLRCPVYTTLSRSAPVKIENVIIK